jgi:hypothetical protein
MWFFRLNRFLAIILLALAVAGCGSNEEADGFVTAVPNQAVLHEEGDGHEHAHVNESEATGQLEVVVVPSELVVGPNRFAVGIFDADGTLVQDAQVHFHYFDLSDPANPVLESEVTAVPIHAPDGYTTIFADERTFDRAGTWGAEIQVRFPDGRADIQRIAFDVLEESISITPGEKAPAITTPTLTDTGGDLSLLTSAAEPNPAFYEMTLTEALSNGKPTVLLLATPAFCQTRFCGPAYEITNALYADYGSTFNFIHVEVFTGLPDPAANGWQYAPVMNAFGLGTEPWLFVIDANGTVTYRVEGIFTQDEVSRQLESLAN